MVRDAKPSDNFCYSQIGVFFIPYPTVEPKVEIFGYVNRLTSDFLEWARTILDFAHPAEATVSGSFLSRAIVGAVGVVRVRLALKSVT